MKKRFKMIWRVTPLILIIPSDIECVDCLVWELRIHGASFTPSPSSVNLEIKLCWILINTGCTLYSHALCPSSCCSFHLWCFSHHYYQNPVHSSKTQLQVFFSPSPTFSSVFSLLKDRINFSVFYFLVSKRSVFDLSLFGSISQHNYFLPVWLQRIYLAFLGPW